MLFCRHFFRQHSPRANQDSKLRRSFLNLQLFCARVFFERCRTIQSVLLADADTPAHGQRHDEDESLQAVVVPELRSTQIEASPFEVGEHRLGGPACGVV